MSLKLFTELEQSSAKHQLLEQRANYRVMQHRNILYLSSGGRAIQGAMDAENSVSVQSPVVAAMLQALWLIPPPARVLNLGIGSAAIERYLQAAERDAQVLSVDVSQHVIELAKSHFFLPDNCETECASAEKFVKNCSARFDVIFCDLAMADKPAACLSDEQFQQGCARAVSQGGVFALNLLCNNNTELKDALLQWRHHFAWLALYTVPGFDNVVMYAAQQAPFTALDASRNSTGLVSEALATTVVLPP